MLDSRSRWAAPSGGASGWKGIRTSTIMTPRRHPRRVSKASASSTLIDPSRSRSHRGSRNRCTRTRAPDAREAAKRIPARDRLPQKWTLIQPRNLRPFSEFGGAFLHGRTATLGEAGRRREDNLVFGWEARGPRACNEEVIKLGIAANGDVTSRAVGRSPARESVRCHLIIALPVQNQHRRLHACRSSRRSNSQMATRSASAEITVPITRCAP